MLNVKRFEVNMLQENCYLLSDETGEAMIIDPGAFYPEEQQAIDDYIRDHHLTLRAVVLTHAHFDHTFGLRHLCDRYNLKADYHRADSFLFDDPAAQVSSIMGLSAMAEMLPSPAGRSLSEGDEVTFGNQTFTVIHTPGHTPGGICLYNAEAGVIFTGDSLFLGSIGRTDFPGGSLRDLLTTLKEKVLTLPDDVKVYSGHGPETTIQNEREHNFYFR